MEMKCNMLRILLLLNCVICVRAQGNLTDLETRVQILETEVTNLEDDVNDVEADIVNLETDINQNEDRIQENTNNIFDVSGSVLDIEDTLVLVLARMTSLEQDMLELQETNNNQSLTITDLESTITELKSTIESLEATNIQQSAEIEGLQTIGNMTVEQLDVVKEDVQDHDTEIVALTEEMLILEEAVEDLEETMAALQVVNDDILGRLTEVEELVMVPWTACTSSPCQNGGTCVDVNVDTFICMCGDGYFGQNCERSFSHTTFLATISAYDISPSDPIVFDLAILNPGSHYDPTSGIYTVPLDGIYQFDLHYMNYQDINSVAYLKVDNVQIAYTRAADDAFNAPQGDLVMTLSLTAGQQVWISPSGIEEMFGSSGDLMFSWFSGHLLYAL